MIGGITISKKIIQKVSMLFVCYVESITAPIQDLIKSLKHQLVQYAYILHDKDIDEQGNIKKPHYHVYLRFKARKYCDIVASMFGIDVKLIQSCQYYQGSIRYFLHYDDLDKVQYSLQDLKHYNVDLPKIFNDIVFEKNKKEMSELSQILQQIKVKPLISKTELLHYCLEFDYIGTYRKYYNIIKDYMDDYKFQYGSMPKESYIKEEIYK